MRKKFVKFIKIIKITFQFFALCLSEMPFCAIETVILSLFYAVLAVYNL
jgi:hypothetical protein